MLVWQTSDAKVIARLASRTWYEAPEASVGWSEDGRMVIVNQDKAARGFRLEDAPEPKTKPGDKPHPTPPPAPRFVRHPPAAVNGIVTEHNKLHLEKGKGEKEYLVMRGNQTKPVATIAVPNTIWHASFFGPDEVVLAGRHGAVMNARTGEKIYNLEGHTGPVLNFAVSPNREYLASLSWDQVLCIHTRKNQEPMLSVYVNERDWVAWTEQGYYAASPGGERLMGWVVETNPNEMCTFHPASRFHARLYRPDVIRLLFKEGSLEKALAKADEALGIKGSKEVKVDDVLPPEAKIISIKEKEGTAAKEGKRIVVAEATPSGADPITAVQLQVDGRPYVGPGDKALITLDKPQKGKVEVTWDVVLPPGKHDVKVLARTEASLGTSRGLSYERAGGIAEKKDPMLYVLAIGIDEYPPGLKLGGCVNDANDLANAFKKHSKPPFSDVEVNILTDKQATRDGMRAGIKWLKEHQTASDVAIFFYAGHGDLDHETKEFYLLPQDINPKDIAKTGLSRAEIKKSFQGVPGRVMVILDACHSGGIGVLFEDLSRELDDEDCGVVVVCAATPSEVAKEQGGHGNLTKAICEGSADLAAKSPKDSCVYLHHLQQYIIDRVDQLSKDTQHPTMVMPPWLKSFSLSKP